MSSLVLSSIHEPATSLSVETVDRFEEFLGLKTDWDSLIKTSNADHPFATHEWMQHWWESFGQNKQLHIVVARDGPAVVGIAPLIRTTRRLYGFKLRTLELAWNPHVPRCDFIVAQQREDVYDTLWSYLCRDSDEWDLLLLQQVPDNSPTLKRFHALSTNSGFLVGLWASDASPYLNVAGTFEDYCENLPRKFRSNLRNRSKRLLRAGNVEHETISGYSDGVMTALAEGLEIEAAAWKGAAGTALLCDENVKTFYERLTHTSSLGQCVRLNFLKCGGRRIAFDFAVSYDHVVYRMKSGYAPEFSVYSPSSLLTSYAIEQCFRDGLRRYDFLGKDEDWKRCWCNEVLPHSWMFIFPRTPRNTLLHATKFTVLPFIKALRSHKGQAGAQPDLAGNHS